ncbi:MAG TPA: glycosyltransferase family 4 protein [Gammaproteobacteria bacterium]|nr:glycosyltransferase family 4 protein [Gammaproteobacteria bacterium]
MNVMFLSHMFPNAGSPHSVPFMLERAKALASCIPLEVVAPVSYFPFVKNKLPELYECIDNMPVYHPRYLALPAFLWPMRSFPYSLMFRLFWQKRRAKYDIFHVEWIYPDAFAVTNFAKKKGIKTVGVVHGNEAIDYYGPRSRRKKYIEAFDALDKIIVVSNELKWKLIREYQVTEEKISVILNGVDVDKFIVRDKIESRKELGLPLKGSVGVCVARLSEEKNLNILIQSVANLPERVPVMYILGDGPLKGELQGLIDRYDIGEWIKMVGPVSHEEIPLWLAASDFLCLPSQREGCPVVIHEALACGRPVISTTVGAIPDLIRHTDYGLLCPPSDVQALSHSLEEVMSRTWDVEKIAAYGQQFTWENVAKQTVEVFNEAMC